MKQNSKTMRRMISVFAQIVQQLPGHLIENIAEIEGVSREMVFATNNFTWSARTIADLYKSRWTVELLFKELKQTLQLQSFCGTNANAVKWQIWAALIVHLILRYQSHLSKWRGSYSRFVGIVRTAIWMKMDLARLLRFYGTAPPVVHKARAGNIPYLPGFEKAYLKAMGQQTDETRIRFLSSQPSWDASGSDLLSHS